MLPRIQRGMFYNMPLVPHCQGSSLMRAFSQHVLHRLGVKQEGPKVSESELYGVRMNSRVASMKKSKEKSGRCRG